MRFSARYFVWLFFNTAITPVPTRSLDECIPLIAAGKLRAGHFAQSFDRAPAYYRNFFTVSGFVKMIQKGAVDPAPFQSWIAVLINRAPLQVLLGISDGSQSLLEIAADYGQFSCAVQWTIAVNKKIYDSLKNNHFHSTDQLRQWITPFPEILEVVDVFPESLYPSGRIHFTKGYFKRCYAGGRDSHKIAGDLSDDISLTDFGRLSCRHCCARFRYAVGRCYQWIIKKTGNNVGR